MPWVFTCAWQSRMSEAFMNFSLCIRPFLSDCAGEILFLTNKRHVAQECSGI